ncbi:MAG: glycosyltransferase family 2 protein [Oscillospiraceae bacterium]|nr:glycosyltransferase family 2 protein [Oscillospiraceae bacterium]
MDLIYVAYNSQKWIKRCFTSVIDSNYQLKDVHIYVVDNASIDNTVQELNKLKPQMEKKVGSFNIIESKQNLGFGRGNNLGFSKGNSDIVCFFNIDTELMPDTLLELEKSVEDSSTDVAMWELRQFPYEHPKLYDALTLECLWSSGAAFAMRRDIYQKMGGFDERIFMYAEDVDLSWRLRSFGYKIKYAPKAVIMHYSYEEAGVVKPNQHVFGVINNLMLRYRFGSWKDIWKGHTQFWGLMAIPSAFPNSKKLLMRQYIKHFGNIRHFMDPKAHGKCKDFAPLFLGWDYSGNRDGGYYVNEFPEENPKVSIIVRTCGRPSVLRETLVSLRNQTYDNLEIVIVEDGENCAGKMVNDEFGDMNIVYFATGEKVGRSKAGNLAMERATGKYLNFLDDDDLFYPDHVEVLVTQLVKGENRAAYSFAFETPIEIYSKEPYEYSVKNYLGIHKQEFDKIMLCHHNYIPIQAIMFEKSLFDEFGGLDESLDALEDWDLWVRYSLHTDFTCVKKTTSIYRVPHNKAINTERQKALDEALVIVRKKHKSYVQKVSVYDIAKMFNNRGI